MSDKMTCEDSADYLFWLHRDWQYEQWAAPSTSSKADTPNRKEAVVEAHPVKQNTPINETGEGQGKKRRRKRRNRKR